MNNLNPAFFCGGKIRSGFIQFGSAYNDCVDLNGKGESKQIIIPAPTGSCKTVSATLYLAEIAKMGMSGLMVVSEVKVAVEMAEIINELAGEKVAGTYYCVNDKNPKHESWHSINKLPRVAIITHALFVQRSGSGKEIDALRSFQGRQRDIIIIDERIDLIKRINFDTGEIVDAVAILKRDENLRKYAEMLSNFNDVIFTTKTNETVEYKGKFKQSHSLLREELLILSDKLRSGRYNLIPRLRGKLKNTDPDRENLIGLLDRIAFVIDGRYYQTVEGKKVFCHREENLSGKFGSVVVLDATSTINPEYDFRVMNNHNIMPIKKIDSRNYSNVTLNICSLKGPRQSKSAICPEPKGKKMHQQIIYAYLKVIGPILDPGDKLLVATYKKIVPLFKEYSPYGDQVEFIHWGGRDVRGSNEFNDFNKAMAIGWFRRPLHYYVASVGSINEFESYIPSHGSMWADAMYLQKMLIIDDIIQFFNRVRCRTAIDKNGNCLSVELYCFTGGDEEMEKIIRASIGKEMPQMIFRDWKPKELKAMKPKIKKAEERTENFISWLLGNAGTYDEIYLSELIKEFGYDKKLVSKVTTSDYFKNRLDEECIIMVRGNGRGAPSRFIFT